MLSLVLLSVILSGPALAGDAPQVYRFGEWTLIAPATVNAEVLSASGPAIAVPTGGLELLAYWQDGSQRAVALRFDALDPKKDVVAMKSHRNIRRLKGCGFGTGARIKPYKAALPKDAEPVTFPDEGRLQLLGSDRSLRRAGDVLVADLGGARVQLAEDSPVVRVGEWDSADFCRFELSKNSELDEESEDH
ncbi:MAG: hypothetical protein V4650_07180 [Pseudomonadota bacterium]